MKTTNPATNDTIVQEGRTTAIVSYITLVGLIVAYVMNKDKKNTFAQFHIRQNIGLFILSFVGGLLQIIPAIGVIIAYVIFTVFFIFWVIGLLGAWNGRTTAVPVVGEKIQEWFKNF
ncbi:DUF4870 domain-containing protein [Sphingobacterium suaedae]|uniref:DUF4870 domain-containing protein n=1 Tax=Sphingobacterium suaedae TaxID=1686402 RepID=A0ABW5KFU7_9SPHI